MNSGMDKTNRWGNVVSAHLIGYCLVAIAFYAVEYMISPIHNLLRPGLFYGTLLAVSIALEYVVGRFLAFRFRWLITLALSPLIWFFILLIGRDILGLR